MLHSGYWPIIIKVMKINVAHVARLANLTLTPAEIKKFAPQLSSVIDYIKKLDEVETGDVMPTSQTTGLEDVWREDVAKESLSAEAVVSQAGAKHKGLFAVKGIFEE